VIDAISARVDHVLRSAIAAACCATACGWSSPAANAGKSSLLNALVATTRHRHGDTGTTRDVLREYIQLDGLPLHVIDTAGLRDVTDIVEQEGVRARAGDRDRGPRALGPRRP